MEPAKFVSAEWLKEQIENNNVQNLRVLDATWHMPAWKRDPVAEFQSCRVKGAVYFDLMEVRDKQSRWSHMVPSKEHFESCVGKLGVATDSHVVLYDNNDIFGMFSVARAWMLFYLFGHKNVSILDGGLPRYQAVGGPTQSGPPAAPQGVFYTATALNPDRIRSYEQMMANYPTKPEQVVDARSAGRYNGTSPEPNPNLYSGHMIGAISVPFMKFFNDNKTMRSADELKPIFSEAGVDLTKPMVSMCGSGMTACWIQVALSLCGVGPIPLYDGSWSEWVQTAPEDTKTPGVRGVDMK